MTGFSRIAFVCQRALPCHRARVAHLSWTVRPLRIEVVLVEVASEDTSYGGFPPAATSGDGYAGQTCFPGHSYHDLAARRVLRVVESSLRGIAPDVVFAPATAFPEGMAAVSYRLRSESKVVMMDDAWQATDQRGYLTRAVKRLIHKNVDAVFVPAPSHRAYFERLGFPEQRIVFGVDAIDNDWFASNAEVARASGGYWQGKLGLPARYFLFVGRFLPRKGLKSLVEAYRLYCSQRVETPWALVLVGSGTEAEEIRALLGDIGTVVFAGAKFGPELCACYGLASALVVPSLSDPWALVVNEAAASGLPLLVSTGCGSARTLVREGENGWTFTPGDAEGLAALMARMNSLPKGALEALGRRSREIVADWGLERFARGALEAAQIPRRPPAGLLSDFLTRRWKGRVRRT